MKKSTAALIAAAGSATAVASIPYFYRQSTDLRCSHYVFRSPKVQGPLDGFRIVQVSDLHNHEFGRRSCRLLALIEAQQPDLIVLTGDLVDSYHPGDAKTLAFVGAASKLAPCYAVTGNHEHRMSRERLKAFVSALEEAGARVLRNEAVELGPHTTDEAGNLMEKRDPDELNILLSHKPHYAEFYEKSGVDLVFSGHAHGGQWRLPLVGGVFAPGQGVMPRYTAGMYRLGKTVMCVSRGLGNSSFPLRIENKPELVRVTLRNG